MKKRIITAWLCFFVLVGLFPTNTYALSCAQPLAVDQAYDRYDAVVVATVDEIIRRKQHNELQLTILNSFKGVEERKLTVAEDLTWGTSQKGEQYLYYLMKKDGSWENPLCSPMQKAVNSYTSLSYLKDKEITLKQKVVPAETNKTNWAVIAISIVLLGAAGAGIGYSVYVVRSRRNKD
ncbi:hypothetical protein LOZ80_27905 [Paenibacillus sp. HWE-109]|uniref:hypothetical protein n=1 Tax=Paenibacillus sp. HWE-109 TaxID=1306526 RepID=UPI001EDE740C|nr:hypothetical protein [Paenibacillus sp. HWE-109]UKS25390.1 hypothetical protein LOZ80_27905 [Paenibacillus sp. HWE-109]